MIKVISAEDKSLPLQRYASEFYIDITKCVFCGYCVEACPVNALAMTKLYEYSTHDKRTLLFDKARLYDIGSRYIEDAKVGRAKNDMRAIEQAYKAFHSQNYHWPDNIGEIAHLLDQDQAGLYDPWGEVYIVQIEDFQQSDGTLIQRPVVYCQPPGNRPALRFPDPSRDITQW